jgi:hypothetical protein
MKWQLYRPRIATCLSACLLAGCEVTPQPETSFIISSEETLTARQLVRTARVLRELGPLDAAQLTELEARLQRIFDREVDAEFARMAKAARRAGKPPPTRAQAKQVVMRTMAETLALPIFTASTRSAVAFGKIRDGVAEVTARAYEVDTPVANLTPGTEVKLPNGAVAKVAK